MFTIVISKYLAYKCIQKFLVFEDVNEGIEHFNILSQGYLDYAKDKKCWTLQQKNTLIFVDNKGYSSFHRIIFIYVKDLPLTKNTTMVFDLPRDSGCLSSNVDYNCCITTFNFKRQEYNEKTETVSGEDIYTYLEKNTPVRNGLMGLWITNKRLLVDFNFLKPLEHEIFFITLQPIKKIFSEPIDKQFFVCYNDIKQEERN